MSSKDSPKASRMGRGGSPTADRLASRASKGALQRSSMPGGGEVFSGDLASRALKSLGARAMTVDKSIIVSDEFDPGRAEDQALYAHEQFHVEHSGGQGSHEARDGEEIAARAVERMVLHRARAGGAESHEAAGAVPNTGSPTGATSASQKRGDQETDSSAQRGYTALQGKGMDRAAIIDKLAHEVIQTLDHKRDSGLERFADKKGFL
jgi:hypothetical protein